MSLRSYWFQGFGSAGGDLEFKVTWLDDTPHIFMVTTKAKGKLIKFVQFVLPVGGEFELMTFHK